ncbi:MAG: hypothetical protein FWF73_04645 [Spirochaetes bacterium]|nr:hypothetical protein [Spirochaetota bacterium]
MRRQIAKIERFLPLYRERNGEPLFQYNAELILCQTIIFSSLNFSSLVIKFYR